MAEEKKTKETKEETKEETVEKKPAVKKRKPIADNVVLVGSKPTMAYVLGVVTQLSNHKEVHIKARGRAISKAVDVAEIVKNKFAAGSKISDIKVDTESMETDRGSVNVSSIDITLSK